MPRGDNSVTSTLAMLLMAPLLAAYADLSRRAVRRARGAGQNNRSPFLQMRKRGLHREEHPGYVDPQHFLEYRQLRAAQRRRRRNARIGVDDVQPAEGGERLGHRFLHACRVGCVRLYRRRVRAKLRRRLVQRRLIAARDHDLRALRDEQPRGRQADSAAAPRNQRHFPIQFSHCPAPLRLIDPFAVDDSRFLFYDHYDDFNLPKYTSPWT